MMKGPVGNDRPLLFSAAMRNAWSQEKY